MKKISELRNPRFPYGLSWIANSLYALFFELPFVLDYIIDLNKPTFSEDTDMVTYWLFAYSLLGLIVLNAAIVFLCRIAKIKPTDTKLYWKVTVVCATMPYILLICYEIACFIRFGTLF